MFASNLCFGKFKDPVQFHRELIKNATISTQSVYQLKIVHCLRSLTKARHRRLKQPKAYHSADFRIFINFSPNCPIRAEIHTLQVQFDVEYNYQLTVKSLSPSSEGFSLHSAGSSTDQEASQDFFSSTFQPLIFKKQLILQGIESIADNKFLK